MTNNPNSPSSNDSTPDNVTQAPAGGLAGGDTTDAGAQLTPLFDIDGPAKDENQIIEETNPR